MEPVWLAWLAAYSGIVKIFTFAFRPALASFETSEMLSTAFQFYEQAMARRQFGNHGIALSYRHWSNAYIKRPNYGMDFLGVQMDLNW
ncbi:MAG: acyloxyacyl hydrolase [Acidiferrobacterales bacterium]